MKARAAAQADKPKEAKKKPEKSAKPAVTNYIFDHPEGEKKNVSGNNINHSVIVLSFDTHNSITKQSQNRRKLIIWGFQK